jgi:hypothetical protein
MIFSLWNGIFADLWICGHSQSGNKLLIFITFSPCRRRPGQSRDFGVTLGTRAVSHAQPRHARI